MNQSSSFLRLLGNASVSRHEWKGKGSAAGLLLATSLCSSTLGGAISNFITTRFTAEASRPALSSAPVLSSSSVNLCFTMTTTGGFFPGIVTNCDSDAGIGTGCSAYVWMPYWNGCADVSDSGDSIVMDGDVGVFPDFEFFYGIVSRNWVYVDNSCISTEFSTGNGSLVFSSFPSGGMIVYKASVAVDTWIVQDAMRSPVAQRRSRIALRANGSVLGVIQRIGDTVTPPAGWSIDSDTITNEGAEGLYWTHGVVDISSPTIEPALVSGGLSLTVDAITADENTLDLNGDGRFDAADVIWLEGEIPSTDGELMARVNLNNDGTSEDIVDEDDVDALIALLGYGLGTPKFGDRDGDGCVTCADALHGEVDVDDQFDDVTPDNPLYNISLDANADGVIDTSDRLAFYALVNHGDLNGDTIVDDDDMVLFGGYYNTLTTAEGDQDGDGDTDDDDFIIFSVRYNELVCPTCS